MPDGTSASWYQRDQDEFRDLLRRTVEIHQRLHREWPTPGPALPAGPARHRLARPVVEDVRRLDRPTAGPVTHPDRCRASRRARRRRGRRRSRRRSPAAGWSTSSGVATCSGCWCRRRSRRATRGRVLGLLWSYVQPLVRFCMYFFVIGLVLGLHKDVPNFAIHMFAGLVVRALLHRDVLLRHPLDRAQQGDRAQDGDAAGDVPGGLGDRLGDQLLPAAADPVHRRAWSSGWTPDPAGICGRVPRAGDHHGASAPPWRCCSPR